MPLGETATEEAAMSRIGRMMMKTTTDNAAPKAPPGQAPALRRLDRKAECRPAHQAAQTPRRAADRQQAAQEGQVDGREGGRHPEDPKGAPNGVRGRPFHIMSSIRLTDWTSGRL